VSWVLVVLGGAVGAVARYLLDAAVTARVGGRLPWGTVVVNVLGSAVFGVLAGLAMSGRISSAVLALVGTGFCGAFTTASTLAWETVALAEQASVRVSAANLALTLGLGLPVAAAGLALGLSG
jgi:fluoride exporter